MASSKLNSGDWVSIVRHCLPLLALLVTSVPLHGRVLLALGTWLLLKACFDRSIAAAAWALVLAICWRWQPSMSADLVAAQDLIWSIVLLQILVAILTLAASFTFR